jgi:hypothetical protein
MKQGKENNIDEVIIGSGASSGHATDFDLM